MPTYAESKTPHPNVDMPTGYGAAKFKLKTWTTTTGSPHWTQVAIEYCGELYGTFLKHPHAGPVALSALQTDRYTFTAPVTAANGKFTSATNSTTTSSTTSISPVYTLPGLGIPLSGGRAPVHQIRLRIKLLNVKMDPTDGNSNTIKVTGDVKGILEGYSVDDGKWIEVAGMTAAKSFHMSVSSHKHSE